MRAKQASHPVTVCGMVLVMLLRFVFAGLSLILVATAPAQRVSPLASPPDWSQLEGFQETITREEFVHLLEHAYAELIQAVPEEIKTVVPVWDQIYLEQFHSRYVDSMPLDQWDAILGLHVE